MRSTAVAKKQATEGDTFEAVRKAINELGDVIRFIINSLNGNYIVVTADHGFLFTESKPDETHRSKIDHKPAGTVHDKKHTCLVAICLTLMRHIMAIRSSLPKQKVVWSSGYLKQ